MTVRSEPREACTIACRARPWIVAGTLVLHALLPGAAAREGDSEALAEAPFDYALAGRWGRCTEAGAERGPASRGTGVLLRKPANHDPTLRHPLVVVFAPARTPAIQVERRIGLTHDLTAAGFLLAFVDAVPLGSASAQALAEVPRAIMRRWCVDPARLYLMGHSDGASFASMLAVMPALRGQVRGIVASAAGVDRPDLEAQGCPPAPVRALVLHSRRDRLFPGFGPRAAAWWAACNRCRTDGPPAGADGCVQWQHCSAPTALCESDDAHARWPDQRREAIVAFLAERS